MDGKISEDSRPTDKFYLGLKILKQLLDEIIMIITEKFSKAYQFIKILQH